ncbi:Clp protease-domain-containing protein [Hypoxylon sp. FL1150]|nr:Clp protease-domain-containing protein [Hypoxylon sp. FL1150]
MNCQRPLLRIAARKLPTTANTTKHAARRFSQFPMPNGSTQPPRAAVPLPYITEVTSGGWRTYDIFSKLLQERIICLNGPIDDTVSASIVAQLLWLESDNPEKAITMYIDSPGGSVTAGLSIYDTMTYIRSPVSTVCLGQAASMGSLLLAGGEGGKRFALPHSSVMIHQPLGGTQGPASDILIYANQIQRTRAQVNEIYRRHLNAAFHDRDREGDQDQGEKYNLKDIEDMMERDKYLTAHEARDMGIVDEILTRRDDKKASGKGKSNTSSGGSST